MSLLNGLKDAMINPLFDSAAESALDDEMDFEFALEAAVDPQIELSEADIEAILDDDNPDNIVSDMTTKDENIGSIEKDLVDEDEVGLEAMLDAIIAANESEMNPNEMPSEEPANLEGEEGCKSACENDDCDDDCDDKDEEDDDEDDEDEIDDDYTTLDSLLNSVFDN